MSVIFFWEGMMFYNHYSYAYQIEQAQSSLNRLEDILDGKGSNNPLGASLLGIYEPKDAFGDIEVRNLAKGIVSSTEYAIKNVEEVKQVSKLKNMVDEISGIQEKQVKVIHNALAKIESKDIGKEVEVTYDKAVGLQAKVTQASEVIQTAIDNHQETIEIDIMNSEESPQVEEQKEEVKEVKPTVSLHKNPIIERIDQQKIEDAKQREANRVRIKLVEEGWTAKRAQEMKNKVLISKKTNMQN